MVSTTNELTLFFSQHIILYSMSSASKHSSTALV